MKKNKPTFYLVLSFILFFSFLFLQAQEVEFIKKFEIGSEEKKEEMLFKIVDVKEDRYGNIFVVDSVNNCIKKFSKKGKFIKEVKKKGQGPGEMINPKGVDFDQKGNVYVNDFGNRRINVYDNDLNYLRTIKLHKSMSIEDFFILPGDKLLVFRSVRITGDKYFNIFSMGGEYIRSFYDEFHPFAFKIESIKEIRNHLSTFVYLPAKANLNKDKTKIAFTHEIPLNPYKIQIMDLKGKVIKTIEKKIKGYNPQKQKKNLGYLISKNKDRLDDHTLLFIIESLHFTKENYLVVQRKDELLKNGSFAKFLISIDIFQPDGELIKEEIKLKERIMSISSKDNVYTVIEEKPGESKVVVYWLRIKE